MNIIGAAILAVAIVVLVGGVVWTNVWYRRQLRAMTPEERKRFDEEMRDEMSVW